MNIIAKNNYLLKEFSFSLAGLNSIGLIIRDSCKFISFLLHFLKSNPFFKEINS